VSDTLVANILSLTLFVLSLLIALRALYLCFQTSESNHRLFILGLSLGILSLTSLATYTSNTVTDLMINVTWFQYISQDICFLFIVLSLATSRERDLRSLIRWELFFFVLLLVLMTPLLPQSFPYPLLTKMVLTSLTFLFCLLTFFFYLSSFFSRGARFALLMSSAFGLMSLGYLLNMPIFINPHFVLLDVVGDTLHAIAALLLLIALLPVEPSSYSTRP